VITLKINELITELEKVKQEHGNLEVRKKSRGVGNFSEYFKRFEPFVAKNKDFTKIQDREIEDKENFLAL